MVNTEMKRKGLWVLVEPLTNERVKSPKSRWLEIFFVEGIIECDLTVRFLKLIQLGKQQGERRKMVGNEFHLILDNV